MLSNALKSSSPRIIQYPGYEHEITFSFRFRVNYAIDNEEEMGNIYREERVKYEKAILLEQLIEGLGKIKIEQRPSNNKEGPIINCFSW